ncbi:MAG: hypothetical protein Ct9H300mP1_03160 [Planctomycetaceae bacterium]|nr:MAG: hypothetical protein Ct9H300mP1_03160 [Planctomycetaceae bacterium]
MGPGGDPGTEEDGSGEDLCRSDHWEAALLAAAMKPDLFSGGEIHLGVASWKDLLKKPRDVGPAAVPGV